ncbi:MAG: hypothetical protein RL230_3075 [Pseudomonadota bacterium]
MARVFTREEFYELVWSKPMTHLAKEFTISDVALHRICKKHDIPNPPLGWWAKKAAGKSVTQTPLPKANVAHLSRITIADGDALLPIVGPLWSRVFGLARVRWAGVTG